jgi:quercetin dioxygenase-like cupin family protein
MVQILDGQAEIQISGETYNVFAGEYIMLPADEPHALFAREQFKMLLTMVRE